MRWAPRRRPTTEELFGPAEGLHSTYRMLRDEVLEASWRAGLGALGDAPGHGRGRDPGGGALPGADQARGAGPAARRGARRRGAGGAQRAAWPGRLAGAAGGAGGVDARRVRDRRGARPGGPARAGRRAARAVAGAVHPSPRRRPGALGLGHRPLPDLSAEVQVRAGVRDPAGADHQPAVRDPHPPGAGALSHRAAARRGAQRGRGPAPSPGRRPGASIGCWRCSRRVGGAPGSAPPTTSSSTATGRWRRWPATTSATCAPSRGPCGWSGASPSRSAPTGCAAGSIGSTSCPTAATS